MAEAEALRAENAELRKSNSSKDTTVSRNARSLESVGEEIQLLREQLADRDTEVAKVSCGCGRGCVRAWMRACVG